VLSCVDTFVNHHSWGVVFARSIIDRNRGSARNLWSACDAVLRHRSRLQCGRIRVALYGCRRGRTIQVLSYCISCAEIPALNDEIWIVFADISGEVATRIRISEDRLNRIPF